MNQKGGVYFSVIISFLMFLFFAQLSYGAEESVVLMNCTCKDWIEFEQKYVDHYVTFFASERKTLPSWFLSQLSYTGKEEKLVYISGVINAFTGTHAITKDVFFDLPYSVGVYDVELNSFCRKPGNEKLPVAGAILVINDRLKKAAARSLDSGMPQQ